MLDFTGRATTAERYVLQAYRRYCSEIVRDGQWLRFWERKVDVNNRVRNTLVGRLHCSRISDLIAWLQQQEVEP